MLSLNHDRIPYVRTTRDPLYTIANVNLVVSSQTAPSMSFRIRSSFPSGEHPFVFPVFIDEVLVIPYIPGQEKCKH